MLPALCLIATGYVSSNLPLAVVLIVASVGFTGISYSAWGVNSLDLAPQFAGQNIVAPTHVSIAFCKELLLLLALAEICYRVWGDEKKFFRPPKLRNLYLGTKC